MNAFATTRVPGTPHNVSFKYSTVNGIEDNDPNTVNGIEDTMTQISFSALTSILYS